MPIPVSPHRELQAGFAVLRQAAKSDLNFAMLGKLYRVPSQIEQGFVASAFRSPISALGVSSGTRQRKAKPLVCCPDCKHCVILSDIRRTLKGTISVPVYPTRF